jgi:hypothetical protein
MKNNSPFILTNLGQIDFPRRFLSIQQAICEYGEKVVKDCGTEFKMRIGINSGPVIVGSIGDDLRMDYTAVLNFSGFSRSCFGHKKYAI